MSDALSDSPSDLSVTSKQLILSTSNRTPKQKMVERFKAKMVFAGLALPLMCFLASFPGSMADADNRSLPGVYFVHPVNKSVLAWEQDGIDIEGEVRVLPILPVVCLLLACEQNCE